MMRRLSKYKGLLAVACVLLMLTIIICSIFVNYNKFGESLVNADTTAKSKASVLNLNERGISQNYFINNIQGKQKDYIYLGTNGSASGALKWRVLSARDSKYSDGDMLLWADSSVFSEQFNTQNNPHYAFWGTSKIRAVLNSGKYPLAASSSTAAPTADEWSSVTKSNSWLYKLFSSVERTNIVLSNNIVTKNWSHDGKTTPRYYTNNIISTAFGNYDPSTITTGVENTTGYYAGRGDNGTVIENTNDYLFLLDYYDINTPEYGFCESDGVTIYAKKVVSSWDPDTYPGYPGVVENSVKATYLIDKEGGFTLRSPGRVNASEVHMFVVNGSISSAGVQAKISVRPAFNFDPANVIYATASNVMSNGATFVAVNTVNGTKPAYKVYLKTADYVNYNENISSAPDITLSGNSVSITKTGQSGKAIILLADKSGNGEVKYQATAEFNGGVATATLPSGVDASGYSITVLFADEVRGGNYAESISASYTNMIYKSPSTVRATYTGKKLSMDNVSDEDKSWYDDQYIDITYPDGMIDVGTYTVKAEIKSAYQTSYVKFSGIPDAGKGETQYIRYFDFKIETRYIDFPTFENGEYKLKHNYAGDNVIRFTLNSFDKNYIEVSYTGGADGVSYEDRYGVAQAMYVGVYELDVKIKDAYGDNCKLRGAPSSGKLEFEVTPAPIEIGILDGTSSNIIGIRNSKKKVTVEIPDPQKKVHMGKKAYIQIYAKDDYTEYVLSDKIELVGNKTKYDGISLNIGLLRKGTYDLTAKVVDGEADGNSYTVSVVNGAELEVQEVEPGSQLLWMLYDGEGNTDGIIVAANIGDYQSVYDNFAYDGREYHFEVTPPNGYEQVSIKTLNSSSVEVPYGKNADEYETIVEIKDSTTPNGAVTSYTIKWQIVKAKFDLSNVKWKGEGKVEYAGGIVEMVLESLPDGLDADYGGVVSGSSVGSQGSVFINGFKLVGDYADNYILPIESDGESYIGEIDWSMEWEIVPAVISVGSNSDWVVKSHTDDSGNTYNIYVLKDPNADGVVEYEYYEADNRNNVIGTEPIALEDIEYSSTQAKYYKAFPKLIDKDNYKFKDGVSDSAMYSPFFTVGGGANSVSVSLASNKIEYNGKPRNVKLVISGSGATLNDFTLTYYSGDIADEAHKLDGAPIERGNYLVVITSNKNSVELSGTKQYTFEIIAATIKKEWNKDAKPYVLNLKYGQIDGIEYEIADAEGNRVEYSQLSAGNKYQIKAVIKEEMRNNYSFTDGTYETAWEEFELRGEDIANMQDPNDPNNTHYPQNEEDNEPDDNNPSGDINSGNEPGGDGGALDELLKKLKEMPLWQLIASFISIILIIIFMSKGIGYASKAKQSKKLAQSKFKEYYAGTFLGLAFSGWTAIACVLMGLAVLSLVFMILEKNRYNKAVFAYEEAKDDFERHRETNRREYDENRRSDELHDLKTMFMQMMGAASFDGMNNANQGMPQNGYMGAQQGIGMDDIRGLISETVTALLPGMQQALPQQASNNDELVNKLIEQNEKLMQQLAEKSTEKAVEKEVAASVANDGIVQELIEHNKKNDERIEQMMRNQEALIAKLVEVNQSAQVVQPQIIEKIVEKPVEKIVEKEVRVEVPVETVVEKVVEKPIAISTEAVGEAEKSQQVKKTPSPKKAPTPRLTLEEAYAKLTKEQKKYFDGLREYAMSKDSKCKEKLSTYFTTIGPSTTNPFIKLTIKKGITVALFKMEDEYLKDIRRNASGDGTKVKVKETEVPIGDKQAYDTAKDMVDLRIDQIERYSDFLKELRALRK